MQTLLPGVQHTQQEQDQAHNSLGIPPLYNTVLTSRGGAVEANNAKQARVASAVLRGKMSLFYEQENVSLKQISHTPYQAHWSWQTRSDTWCTE